MDLQFTTDWFTQHIPLLERNLRRWAGKPNLRFLEIGSWEGRSACWFLQNILTHPSSSLTCIDTFMGSREHNLYRSMRRADDIEERFDHNVRTIGAENRVMKYKGPSAEVLRTLPLRHYDLIYIDGSHIVLDVLRDAVLSWDLLKTSGLLLFDDYGLRLFRDPADDPKTAINAFCTAFRGEAEVVETGWQVLVRKHERSPAYPEVICDLMQPDIVPILDPLTRP
jgi:predicted O-methyltransferase YrrM